jgi:hypothetical protein
MNIVTHTCLVVAGLLALGLLTASTASAGTQNLQCHGGFQKVQTYASSIKCKRVQIGYPTKLSANKAAKVWSDNASCNAHMSAPRKKVWKTSGKWKARVTFICANIT